MELLINDKPLMVLNNHLNVADLRELIEKELGLKSEEYYLICNGKRVEECNNVGFSRIHIVPRIFGGKGGFGSMLRAIGAQIEKTTNREACRDLSGRRLRDINEEQRLKNWINQQAEREKEAKERKQKKLERLCERPRHEFKDEQYDKERSELPEMVEDAVLRGLQASCSTKRKVMEEKPVVKKKKAKLWMDDELEDDLSGSESEDEESGSDKSVKISGTDSDNSKCSGNTNEPSKGTEGVNNAKDCEASDDNTADNAVMSENSKAVKNAEQNTDVVDEKAEDIERSGTRDEEKGQSTT